MANHAIDCGLTDSDLSRYAANLKSALSEVVMPQECERVSANRALSHGAWVDMCDTLEKLGDRQLKCQLCSKFRWTHEQCAVFQH